jgi:hypothetical protein
MPKRNNWPLAVIVILMLGLALLAWRSRNMGKSSPQPNPPPDSSVNQLPVPQDQTISVPSYSVKKQGKDQAPVYVFRLFTVGSLTQENNTLHGQGFFPWDTKRRITQFDLRGGNNTYTIGVCTLGGLCDYANRIETLPFSDLNSLIPHNSLIQLKIPTSRLSGQDQALMKTAFDHALKSDWKFDDITFHPFEIDIILGQ